MRIERILLREIAIPLKRPFVTAHGVEKVRHLLIVEASADGLTGYGEVSALATPFYTEETHETARLIMESFIIPLALKAKWQTPAELATRWSHIRRHYMAKAGMEGAIWDLFARAQAQPLHRVIGGTKSSIPAGVAVGIERDLDQFIQIVGQRLQEGYRRIKIKIEPGWDVQPIQALRNAFGDIPLIADANSAYTLADTELLQRLDQFNLLMIEQPLAHDDFIDHAQLQAHLQTPLCLDESILSLHHAQQAVALGSCRIVNLKIGRVGGLSEALRIHNFCHDKHIPLWCGGMLESGIGRAHNIALASLPGFTIPGDISASARYWERDIIHPEVTVTTKGCIDLPDAPGIGYGIDMDALDSFTVSTKAFQ